MTKPVPKNWQQALSDVVRKSLIVRTEGRYDKLTWADYNLGKGNPKERTGFFKAWTSSVEEMHYLLRSARTMRLFASTFTQTLCAGGISQWGLYRFYDDIYELMHHEERWQDLRDVFMLALSARSYLKPVTPEEN